MSLSIIIVSWNVRDLLRDCLASVYREAVPGMEVIVVDSGSADGSAAMVHEEFAQVRLIALEENVGFSRGNNIGIEAASGDMLLLLNPDTVVVEGALTALVATMNAHPEAGVVGPMLLNEDGSVQPSRRRFPTLWTAFFESTWLQKHAPRRVLDHYYVRDRSDDEAQPVDWVQGAAFVVRRAAVEAAGLLDEGYFMYSEEMDWQKRIREAGWDVHYAPAARIVHFGGKSSDQVRAQRDIYFHTSKIRYFRLHHGAFAAGVLRLFLLASYVHQLLLEGLKGALGHKRAMRRERVAAYWQVLRSGLK
ncbi:MAG: glycosyltransferase family 2 protein [Chloroflexi bacterium]|nr:glycosyltransferase family 2 protein [Chloroflexota bacterium]